MYNIIVVKETDHYSASRVNEYRMTLKLVICDPAGTKLEPLPYGFKAISESVCRLST